MALKDNLNVAKDLAKKGYGFVYDLLGDEDRINDLIKKAQNIVKKFPGGRLDDIADTLEDIRIYILLVRDYLYKEYRDIKKKSIIIMAIGLLYVVSPIDLIPDTFGAVGLMDDAAVMRLVKKLLEEEIDAYKEWRKTTGKDAPEVDDEDEEEDAPEETGIKALIGKLKK